MVATVVVLVVLWVVPKTLLTFPLEVVAGAVEILMFFAKVLTHNTALIPFPKK